MLTLSPWKILVIIVVALLVLGPEKLPSVARQAGGFWGDLRRFRARLEDEVRGVFPDLPPSHEVASAVRSPIAYLNRLADEHDRHAGAAEAVADAEGDGAEGDGAAGGPPAGTARAAVGDEGGGRLPTTTGAWRPESAAEGIALPVPDDPSMN